MRVCLETSAFRSRFGGIAYYAYFLCQHLLADEADLSLSAFDGRRFRPITPDWLAEAAAADEAGGRRSGWIYNAGRNTAAVRTPLRAIKSLLYRRGNGSFDLFHALNAIPPGRIDAPVLPLIHDISYERYPQTHPTERVAWLRRTLRKLDHYPIINTVSQFSAGEIADFYSYPRENIRVTNPGINPAFREGPRPDGLSNLGRMDVQRGNYFLMVGTLEPRKNHAVLIEAYARMPPSFRKAFPLICVGQPSWRKIRSDHLEGLRREGSIRFFGYCDVQTLVALYASARRLVFPTLYEGFGIPVAEAMACGLPMILSDIPIMHEVAGQTATFVSPFDVDGWTQAIREAAESRGPGGEALRGEMIARSKAFDWAKTAAETAAVYREFA